jgi:hypothetical protein
MEKEVKHGVISNISGIEMNSKMVKMESEAKKKD